MKVRWYLRKGGAIAHAGAETRLSVVKEKDGIWPWCIRSEDELLARGDARSRQQGINDCERAFTLLREESACAAA